MKFEAATPVLFAVFRLLSPLILTSSVAVAADFVSEVQPVLEAKCVGCHNPNTPKGDLSLASAESVFGADLIQPGEGDASELYRIATPSHPGATPEMPEKGDPLTPQEAAALKAWIDGGAVWPEGLVLREASKADRSWWAYQPLGVPEKESIDAYIDQSLEEKGLERNGRADKRSLIRRLSYDLTGLPPTAQEVKAFEQDEDPKAYEKLVDRLLASPRYGERWGRHWLDVVRFGESNGFERNKVINNLWPFRDYVIESINADKPFDQLIREHLAGDIMEPEDPDSVVGSAFLVAGPYDDVRNQDAAQAAQIRANTLDEIINATGEAFLGMTLGCARCHDHKFDPITLEDYYGLYATFAGVRHGSAEVATPEARAKRATALKPLHQRKAALEKEVTALQQELLARGKSNQAKHEKTWVRPAVNRRSTEERFDPVPTRWVRLVCESVDVDASRNRGFRIDEMEVWNAGTEARNVALASNGARAHGAAREIEDFPDAYGAHHAIDGKLGARFVSTGEDLRIELPRVELVDRVVFSSAQGEEVALHNKFTFPADYRIEVSLDGVVWQEVANGRDRRPVDPEAAPNPAKLRFTHKDVRLMRLEQTEEESAELARLRFELGQVQKRITAVRALPSLWVGSRVAEDAAGPFHTFIGGNPQRPGTEVTAVSLSTLEEVTPTYHLPADAEEGLRRQLLAEWITDADNPLAARVMANRLWHYHFGTGIVDTPNDFGYMGGRPTHPELLDFLAVKLKQSGWRWKPMHRLIVMSETYRQASTYRPAAAEQDGDSRLLWRFPPRRLSAEELRDTLLAVSGKLDLTMGGPGFRLYHFMQDNVCTYEPLDEHGPETYRRAIYHQNARASVVDLMTEYDQPDCAFSTPKRAQTTTPLQALTLMNHSFTMDMATALAERVGEGKAERQARRLFALAFQRPPDGAEREAVAQVIREAGLRAACRAVLNTSELLYLD